MNIETLWKMIAGLPDSMTIEVPDRDGYFRKAVAYVCYYADGEPVLRLECVKGE